MTFADVVYEVYGTPPDEFVAARTAAARVASAHGDRALARQLSALKKPSTAAAAVNALVRADGNLIAELNGLHAELAQAQDGGDRQALQSLGARRRALVAELTDRATEHARLVGWRVGAAAADQVRATFLAAVSDDVAAKAVASGCLVRGLSAAGFGADGFGTSGLASADIEDAVALPSGVLQPVSRANAGSPARSRSDAQEQARVALKDAMRAATRAAADLQRSDAVVRRAEERRTRLQAERDDLRARLAQLDEQLAAGDRELEEAHATRREAAAEAQHAEHVVASAHDEGNRAIHDVSKK